MSICKHGSSCSHDKHVSGCLGVHLSSCRGDINNSNKDKSCYDNRLNKKKTKSNEQSFSKPNPKNYKIVYLHKIKNFLIVKINYPNCTNYEGNKILVFKNVSIEQINEQGFIDPHFCDGDHISPIARFVPTDEGLSMAFKLAKIMTGA